MVVEQDKERIITHFVLYGVVHLFSSVIHIMKYYSRAFLRLSTDNGRVPTSWDHVRAPLLAVISSVLIVGPVLLLMRHFRVLLTLTDSSCAEGFYRLVDAPIRRGELVAACLPVSAEREGMARGYLMRGDCPGGAEPVVKVVGGLAGDQIESKRDRSWSMVSSCRTARRWRGTVRAGRLAHVPWGKRQVGSE